MATQVDKRLQQCFPLHTFPFLTPSISQHTYALQNQPFRGDSPERQNEANTERKSWEGGGEKRKEKAPLRCSALKIPSWGEPKPSLHSAHPHKELPSEEGTPQYHTVFSNKGSVCSSGLSAAAHKGAACARNVLRSAEPPEPPSQLQPPPLPFSPTPASVRFLSLVTKKTLTNTADRITGLLQIKHCYPANRFIRTILTQR